jgi:glutaminase
MSAKSAILFTAAAARRSAAQARLDADGGAAQTPRPEPTDAKIQAALDKAYARFKDLKAGKNADYIPALAKVDPKLFGIALIAADGRVFTAGDVKTEVSIQSISKVFTMAKVIDEQGPKAIADQIGTDATGMRFDSIVSIEFSKNVLGGPELNSLVNAGAIATTSMVRGDTRRAIWNNILSFHSSFAGRRLAVNHEVLESEAKHNQRNRAICALMHAYGYIRENPDRAAEIYMQQCALSVNARDLATMAATLANAGWNPITCEQVMKAADVPRVLAVMATAGLYDDSGKWLYKTGLPAKSSVSGGIIAVSPGRFGIAVISPPLDDAGNSIKAQKAIEAIAIQLGGNPYAVAPITKRR